MAFEHFAASNNLKVSNCFFTAGNATEDEILFQVSSRCCSDDFCSFGYECDSETSFGRFLENTENKLRGVSNNDKSACWFKRHLNGNS